MSNITKVYGGRATITFNEGKHYYTVTVPGVVEKLYQPSVTSVIGMMDKSNALVPWAVATMTQRVKQLVGTGPDLIDRETLNSVLDAAEDSWRKVKNDAAEIGSLVHRVLEAELLYRANLGPAPALPIKHNSLLAPNLTEEMVGMANKSISAGFEFYDNHEIKLVQAEAPRWSPTYGYIGTGDCVAFVDGDLCIWDLKTSKRLYSTVFLQTAAYQMAYQEEHPEQKIIRRIGVNVGRDGVLSTEERDNETLENDFGTFIALRDVYRWNMANQGKWSKPAHRILGPLDKVCGPLLATK